mgnify:CR=1 FL=1
MATTKKNDQPSNPQKDRAHMLAGQATKLRKELHAAKEREDGLRMERTQLEKANGELSKKLDAYVQTAELVYTIERINVGGKFHHVRRVNHGLNAHELLGMLTVALDDVKAQIAGRMACTLRHVVEQANRN